MFSFPTNKTFIILFFFLTLNAITSSASAASLPVTDNDIQTDLISKVIEKIPQNLSGIEEFKIRAESTADGMVASIMHENNILGLTLSIVKDGQVILSKGYGYSALSPKQLVDPDNSLFRIGSVSKTITWTAIMQLVEAGKIDLHSDVNQYLKTFQLPQAFGKKLTLNDIMAHRPGYEDGGAGYLFTQDPASVGSLREMLANHIPAQVRSPGEAVSYSNYTAALAGLIIENVSGLSFADYVEKNIFRPLKMNHSTFREPLGQNHPEGTISEDLAKHFSGGFSYSSGRHHDYGVDYVHQFGPAGSASSTASDMARYMMAHLNKGELDGVRILKEETVDRMRQRNFSDRLDMIDFSHGFFNGKVNGYEYFGHGGAITTFKTMMKFFPELQLGVFVSINQGEGTVPVYNMPRLFVETLFPAKVPLTALTPSKDFVVSGVKYQGSYMNNRRSYERLEKIISLLDGTVDMSIDSDGYLLRNQGGKVTSWVEIKEGVFRNVESDAIIKFDFADDGSVIRFNADGGHVSMDKVGFLQTPNFFFLALGLTGLFSLTTLIGFVQRRKMARVNKEVSADWMGIITSIIGLILIISLVKVATSLGMVDYYIWPTTNLKLAVWLSCVSSVIFIIFSSNAVTVWRKSWPLMKKLNRCMFAFSGLFLVFALWQWNLLNLLSY